MTVRIGLGLFTGQVPPGSSRSFAQEYRESIELARLAEATGFDSIWVSEHHGSSDGYLPSLLPMLAAIASATERILLGTGVLLAPLHDPLRLAEDAAVVDQLSGGRLLLGLGVGWREEEFRMFHASTAERARRIDETVEVLRRAWSGRRFSFQGHLLRYDRVKVTPPPAAPGGPPVYLGGYAEAALRRAGRIGDGYVIDTTDLEEARRLVATVLDAARGAGRDPGALGLALLHNASVARDGDAWEAVRPGVAHQLGTYEAWDAGADTPRLDRLVPAPPDEAALRSSTAAGSPEEVALALRPFVAAFGDRERFDLVVRLHYPGSDLATSSRAVELFAAEVIPALKGT
jgi:probable F420-dependent oxidoreductase